MRALISETPGGPESLKLMEMPSRPLGRGQVRVGDLRRELAEAHLQRGPALRGV